MQFYVYRSKGYAAFGSATQMCKHCLGSSAAAAHVFSDPDHYCKTKGYHKFEPFVESTPKFKFPPVRWSDGSDISDVRLGRTRDNLIENSPCQICQREERDIIHSHSLQHGWHAYIPYDRAYRERLKAAREARERLDRHMAQSFISTRATFGEGYKF